MSEPVVSGLHHTRTVHVVNCFLTINYFKKLTFFPQQKLQSSEAREDQSDWSAAADHGANEGRGE